MADRGDGRIVFVTSISSYTASVNRGEYCISKAGLSMSVALYAQRLAEVGVKAVRAIADGLLDYSTGQVLNVDGGFSLRSL